MRQAIDNLHTKFLFEDMRGKDRLYALGLEARMALRRIFKKYGEELFTRFF
jgi:hypothetical protein